MKEQQHITPILSQENAARISTDPATFANHPILRRIAWRALKAQRGQTVDMQKLSEMAA